MANDTTCPSCSCAVPHGSATCPGCGARVDGITESLPIIESAAREQGVSRPVTEEGPLLVVVKGPDTGLRFALDRARTTIGRSPDNDVFLNDVTVSRRHAVIERDGAVVRITDADSLNGTYVNGAIVVSDELENGDHMQIGRFLIVYFSGGFS